VYAFEIAVPIKFLKLFRMGVGNNGTGQNVTGKKCLPEELALYKFGKNVTVFIFSV